MLGKIALKIVFWTLYHIFYFEVLHDRGEKLRLTKTRSDILQGQALFRGVKKKKRKRKKEKKEKKRKKENREK